MQKNLVFEEDYWGYQILVVKERGYFIATVDFPEGGNYCFPHAYKHFSVAVKHCMNWVEMVVSN